MCTFLFIRHGFCASVGNHITGRKSGVHLDAKGIEQVKSLCNLLADIQINRIYTSPLERTVETAELIAFKKKLAVKICDDLNEIDYGDWTGMTFKQLESDPLWRLFNVYRGTTRVPGGEIMIDVAARMSLFVEKIRREEDGVVAVVSHGDPIKSVLAHYCGMPLDSIVRFDVEPASVSSLVVDDYGAEVLCVNKTAYNGM